MKKILLACLFILASATGAMAQVLPDLPPADSSATASSTGSLPDLPPMDNASSASAPPQTGGLPDLPPLEGEPVLKPVAAPQAQEGQAKPEGSKPAGEGAALPALPGEQPAATPEAKAEEKTTAEGQAGLPALPGEASTGTTGAALPALPGEEKTAAAAPAGGVKAAGKPAVRKMKPEVPAPNTMFGGWVMPKGRNEITQLAWSSQEILNALIGSKYELLKEEGEYNSRGWREFTFQQAKTKRQVHVFVKAVGKRVWMRVGPPEPPAGVPFKESMQVRKDHEIALKILQKQFGKRFTKKGKTWEAPFDRPKS